ncbi:hypothetical protein BH11GEM1_BH11GEM1_20970 [soil metagenome]
MQRSPNKVAHSAAVCTLAFVLGCGGSTDGKTPVTTQPPVTPTTPTAPAGPTAITVTTSRDSLVLDAWADTASLAATVRDQAGGLVSSATTVWASLDTAVVTVGPTGALVSVRPGVAKVRVTASLGSLTPATKEVTVNVARQRNVACIAPTVVARGAAAGVPAFGTSVNILTGLPGAAWDGSRSFPADYDGDGDADLVRIEYSFPKSTPYGGTTRVFRNDGGTLSDATAQVLAGNVVPDHARDFEIRDFTGDRVPDIYVAQHGFDAAPFPGAANLLFTRSGTQLVERAAAAFSPYSRTSFSHAAASADVDCDGDLDLVELNLNANAPNYLFLNNGSGTFSTAPVSAFPIGVLGQSTAQRWQEAEFIDFDSDGDADLFLGARSGTNWNEDVMMVNDGFGRFRVTSSVKLPAPRFTPEHGVNNVKSADFNGDGRLDLLLFEIPKPFTTTSAIRLWLNAGNGQFQDASAAWGLPATCGAEMIEPLFVVDFNKDGLPDVALPPGCPELGNGGILFNQGSAFASFKYSSIQPWLEFGAVTPLDIDSDGDPDLVFSDNRGKGNPPVLVRNPR